MRFIEVESSNLKGVFYKGKTNELFVKFKNDSVYRYEDVPKSVYEELLNAESKGKFFAQNVKTVFHYENVTGKEDDYVSSSLLSEL